MNKFDWALNKKKRVLTTDEISNIDDSSNNSNSIYSFSNHIYFNDEINKIHDQLRLCFR